MLRGDLEAPRDDARSDATHPRNLVGDNGGMPSPEPAAAALRAGETHLARAEWAAARRAYGEAVVSGPSPAAYEGLSWAAWWLDDADTVFDARQRAYQGYLDRSEVLGAGRVATWLACDHLDFRGATSVAGGWLRRAHRLIDERPECAEHGWLAFHEGYLAGAVGDTTTAMRLGGRARDIGRRCAVPDLEMLGLALLGSGRVGTGQVADGLRDLDEAQVMTGEAAHPIAAAWTSCFLVSSCLAVLDLDRAFQWCDVIEQFAERYGSRYMLAFCRAEYGVIHLWRGEWDAAEKLLEAAVADFTHSRPAMVGGPLTVLAELRRRQGRTDDAVALLEDAGASPAALSCRARLELDRARRRRATELAERAVRGTAADRVVDRVGPWETLARARAAVGDLPGARAAVDEVRRAGAIVGSGPVQALADAAAGACATAGGEYDGARVLLEDAATGFERAGATYEAARARLDVATCLLGLGRAEAAAEEARAALRRLEGLGAEVDAARARQLVAAADSPDASAGPPVTQREREVLALLADGLTNRQIADRLVVSEHTVHRHVTNILRKLDLPSRTAAAAYAVRAGLSGDPAPSE